ncbi:hypothetical protein IQ254_07215 [Nodosilinea sp. LEGE 07088]|uniref:Ycf66 family protein n=1 Tax=Nodosilinea sp. LEGE 07088 TaxID=2777968 RepID=UPI001882F905|nr:Ycf66 family protein [Nodosilinea sp. LEGE 07088]MBE9136993.1 hypothetical protein [Nodosilinea sp. LEGE 07088]
MGVQVLAIAIWAGSLALYGAAFFFPEVHRRHDFFWSGLGAFYGLVLWFCADQTSPTELLGHGASVVLLGWLSWQTLTLRRKRTPLDLQTPLTPDSWPNFWRQRQQALLGLLRDTPLARWLPLVEPETTRRDPAIATSEVRASSLKDVDYEFVDELSPTPRRPARTADSGPPFEPILEPGEVKPKSSPAEIKRLPRDTVPLATQSPRPVTLGSRLAGLQAWVNDLIKAKTAPKPRRAVIDIPPRPSPLARTQTQPSAATGAALDGSTSGQAAMVTIVDAEAVIPKGESETTQSEQLPDRASAPADVEAGNWPDDLDESFVDPDHHD